MGGGPRVLPVGRGMAPCALASSARKCRSATSPRRDAMSGTARNAAVPMTIIRSAMLLFACQPGGQRGIYSSASLIVRLLLIYLYSCGDRVDEPTIALALAQQGSGPRKLRVRLICFQGLGMAQCRASVAGVSQASKT